MCAKHYFLFVLTASLFDCDKVSEIVDRNIIRILRHKLGDHARSVALITRNTLCGGYFLKYIKHFLFSC